MKDTRNVNDLLNEWEEPSPEAKIRPIHESAHHLFDGEHWYADTAFMNAIGNTLPGMKMEHMGFGEFTLKLKGPDGEIEFDRMRGKDFPEQDGRSHQVYDNKDGKLVEKLITAMEKAGKSKRVDQGRRLAEDLNEFKSAKDLDKFSAIVDRLLAALENATGDYSDLRDQLQSEIEGKISITKGLISNANDCLQVLNQALVASKNGTVEGSRQKLEIAHRILAEQVFVSTKAATASIEALMLFLDSRP